jgi:hypothetical protein
MRDRVLTELPCPHVAWPEKVLPTATGHGGDATGALKEHEALNSGTVSERRKTPELLNNMLVVVEELTHCWVPGPLALTTRVLCDATASVVDLVPVVSTDEPLTSR